MADLEFLFDSGILLIIVGLVISILAAVLMVSVGKKRLTLRGGGVVIIGPFPVIFGTDKESVKILLILSIILVSILFIFSILTYLLSRGI
jgi:uncharacterized protein (TIGR00304 family)